MPGRNAEEAAVGHSMIVAKSLSTVALLRTWGATLGFAKGGQPAKPAV